MVILKKFMIKIRQGISNAADIALLQILMNRRQKRASIIQYFLRIAQAQQEVQTLQNELISHLRFNPAAIFKKIANNCHTLTIEQLRHYIQKRIGITDREVIRVYMEKHRFQNNIQLSQFSASLLPYTPNVLRQVTEKIEKKMETKHLDRIIESLYQKLLEEQLKNIYQISLFQKELALDWQGLKALIQKDFNQKLRKIDSQEEICGMVSIRRWLQLWIEIEEYKILNIMRWFGGGQEIHVQSYYLSSRIHLKCSCSNLNSRHILSSLSKRPQTSIEKSQLKKVKSATILSVDTKQLLKNFFKYVDTILKSQRRLQLLREGLCGHKRQVQMILHQIASKKSNSTRLGKIVSQIQKILRIKPDMICKLLTELEHTKIDNNFLFSLFAAPSKKGKTQNFTRQQLFTEIYQVLYTFCLSKATLKSIARQIKDGANLIFREFDENSRNFLDVTDLKLILNEFEMKYKEEDLKILMNHLGDGQKITQDTFKEVFIIQSLS